MRCAVLLLSMFMSLSSLSGCAQMTPQGDLQSPDDLGAAGDLGESDGTTAGDLADEARCLNVRECAFLPRPQAVRACPTSGWSCIAGRCTLECRGGRSCYPMSGGCLNCDGKIQCPGSACVGPALSSGRIEDATCQRGFLSEIDSCFGDFVHLRDGMICSVQELPTGAIREVVACGACQIQLVF